MQPPANLISQAETILSRTHSLLRGGFVVHPSAPPHPWWPPPPPVTHAQIAGMCNYSSSIAFRNGREEITMQDLISAVEQSKYGRSYDVVR